MSLLGIPRQRPSTVSSRWVEAGLELIANDDASIGLRKPPTVARILGLLCMVIAGLLACAGNGGSAFAQANYPLRPITLIVPFPTGGPSDVVARIVGPNMSQTLGQPIVIENVVGAGGTTGTTRTMRAAPDGYTIMLGHMGTHGAAVALYPKLAYNPTTDFAPIGMVAGMPVLIIAKNTFPARNLGELMAYVKLHGADVIMAHGGMASVSQVTCQLFNSIAGLSPKTVAFQGTVPAMDALAAGRVDYMCEQIVSVFPQAIAHTIKAYAIDSLTHNRALPDVPTVIEAGLPEFNVSAWNALFAPKNTPQPIIAKLNDALVKALDDGKVRKRLLDLGSDIPNPAARSPEALAAVVKSEIIKWKSILKPAETMN